MAIKNDKGNYLKITTVDPFYGVVNIEMYQDEQHRKDGNSEFRTSIPTTETIETKELLNAPCDKGSLQSNILKQAYKALKKLPKYENYEDC